MCNLLNKEFLVMGKSEINPSAFEKVSNDDFKFDKPSGGLWSSLFDNEIGSEWVRFCSNEMPERLSRDCVKFKLKEDSKVFILDNELKLKDLLGKYPRELPIKFLPFADTVYLDFEKLSNDYDAFFLDYNWFKLFRVSSREAFVYYHLFDLWDVSTLMVFNLDCIKSWEYFSLDVEEEYYD